MLTFILFLVILGVLIFVHELGHFMVAKWMGVQVDEFGIGLPPTIWKKKKGDTVYALNAIPFGGYIKMRGENPEEAEHDDNPGSFENKSVWARMAVILAGVTMNVLFAFVVLVIAFSIGFSSFAQDLAAIPGAKVTRNQVLTSGINSGSAAEKAGLQPGDILISFTDSDTKKVHTITSSLDVSTYTKAEQEAGRLTQTVKYDREGKVVEAPITLSATGYPLGVALQPYNIVRVPVWRAPTVAVKEMGFILELTWDALKGFGHKLFFQAQLDPNVSGPVGIYQATGSATRAGVIPTVFLVVALSLNLAIMNLLPIPALDGGRLVFLLTEAIFRKRVIARKIESGLILGGFVFVLGLIFILSIRDVIRLF